MAKKTKRGEWGGGLSKKGAAKLTGSSTKQVARAWHDATTTTHAKARGKKK